MGRGRGGRGRRGTEREHEIDSESGESQPTTQPASWLASRPAMPAGQPAGQPASQPAVGGRRVGTAGWGGAGDKIAPQIVGACPRCVLPRVRWRVGWARSGWLAVCARIVGWSVGQARSKWRLDAPKLLHQPSKTSFCGFVARRFFFVARLCRKAFFLSPGFVDRFVVRRFFLSPGFVAIWANLSYGTERSGLVMWGRAKTHLA